MSLLLTILEKRGFDVEVYGQACIDDPTGQSDDVVLSHPILWMSEREAESEMTLNAVMEEINEYIATMILGG